MREILPQFSAVISLRITGKIIIEMIFGKKDAKKYLEVTLKIFIFLYLSN
tara:strand:+ start:78 stop:227 length:150 start_codon:yes stop_codon:yes gene_type:complete